MEEPTTAATTTTTMDEARREETPNERAQRILMMCNMVEESRERVKKAEMVTTEEEMTNVGSDGEESANGNQSVVDDDVSIAYSHMSVSDLGYEQLKDKLRQCQLTILKVQENSTLKYQRLQVEHRQLKESLITLQSEYKFVQGKNKLFTEERDAATKNAEMVAKTRDEMMEKVTNENDDLRKQIDSMKFINKRLMKQRDEFRCQLDGCTCQAIELDDMTCRSKKKPLFSPSSESVSGSSSSRRGLFGRHQQQYNCNTDDNDDDEDDEEHFHLHNTSKPKIIMTRVDDASTQSTIFSDSFRSQRSDYTRQKNSRNNIFANLWKNTKNSFQAEECHDASQSHRSLRQYPTDNKQHSSTSRSRRWS